MPKNIGIKELAKIAGVSIGTIDRVIHNRAGVSEKTRQRVLGIIDQYNYKPNLLAKHLASKKQFKIAVLMPSGKENPVWEPYELGIRQATEEIEKFAVEVDHIPFDQYNKNSFISAGKAALAYDAVMWVPIFEETSTLLMQQLQNEGKYVLCFDTNLAESPAPFIGQYAHQAGRLAASLLNYTVAHDKSLLLVNLGRKAGYHLNFWGREQGFKAFFEGESAPQRELLSYEGSIAEANHLEAGLRMMLSNSPQIGGIFVPNSRVYWVAQILAQLKRSDILLLGFDLIPENTSFLKSGIIDFLINQHPKAQAFRGVEWLMRKLVFGAKEAPQAAPIDIVMKENLEKSRLE